MGQVCLEGLVEGCMTFSLFRFLLLSTSLFLVSLMSSAGPFGCTYLQPLSCWSGPEVASSVAPPILSSGSVPSPPLLFLQDL